MIDIIPAIDIIGAECVRLSQGDYSQKTSYYKEPLDIAKRYEEIGVRRLHIVDLDGAKSNNPLNLATLEKIAHNTSLDIQFGGGIKSESALDSVFSAGASRAICGSIAIKNPQLFKEWLAKYGNKKIILGADIKDGLVAINGWLESSKHSIFEIIDDFKNENLSQVICTDISKDGMLGGPNFDLYQDLQSRYPDVDITVSGGISCFDDINQLNDMNLRSVIVGKAIYEGRIELKEIERWLQKE